MIRINILNKYLLTLVNYRSQSAKEKWFKADYTQFLSLAGPQTDFQISDSFPCLNDKDANSGTCKGHYFHQDLYVAHQIFLRTPKRHIDIGSRVDGFVTHVATFREIEVADIRPLQSSVSNIRFTQMDLMKNISDEACCDSLSCLHALEHFGLGRYGDTLDPDGHRKGFANMSRLLQSGGTFYFSVPIGTPQRIEFNAHRIFSLRYLMDMILPTYSIESFSYVDDEGDFHPEITLTESSIDTTCGCQHGCGIFVLKKK